MTFAQREYIRRACAAAFKGPKAYATFQKRQAEAKAAREAAYVEERQGMEARIADANKCIIEALSNDDKA